MGSWMCSLSSAPGCDRKLCRRISNSLHDAQNSMEPRRDASTEIWINCFQAVILAL
jgi:hypothetical protein